MKMKYKLDTSKLAPGDIILVGTPDKLSKEIRDRTNCDYSHAMLMWDDSLLHARKVIIAENPSRKLYDEGSKACVLRLKEQPGRELRIQDLLNYARSLVGTYYDFEAVFAIRRGEQPIYNPNRQTCSKFVAECFDYVCLDVVKDYESCTPADLYASDSFDHIEDVLVEASVWDVEYAESKDTTKLQYEAIVKVIETLLRWYPDADIMSFEQLNTFVACHISEANRISQLLAEVGYFNLWEKEQEYCPYLYEVEQFKSFWKDDAVITAIKMKKRSEKIAVEKDIQTAYFQECLSKYGDNDYYHAMIQLQFNVIESAKKRIGVANKILEENHVVKIRLPWL